MNSKLETMKTEELVYDDSDFGWSNVSEYTSHAMALVQAKPELAVPVLSEVAAEWPTVYAAGGRKVELVNLIKKVLTKHIMVVLMFLMILTVACGEVVDVGNTHAQKALVRSKREGLGQWEQDETVNIVGSWARKAIDVIVQEEKKIVETVEKTAEKIETEIKVLVVSSGRVIVWSLAIILLAVILRLTYPIIIILIKCLWRLILSVFRLIAATTFCMKCCALAPFLAVRNWYINRKLRRTDDAVQIEEAVQLQPSVVRNTSEVYFDEFGPYVKGTFGDKIYFSRQQLDVSTYMALGQNLPSERFREDRVKETMLGRSIPHTTKALPEFQAYFTSDGNVVGHCARIQFKGRTCLLTAYHVLSYNIKADLFLNANGKAVRFSDVRVQVLAFSNEENLDYIVLTIPDTICAKLGLKKAKLARGLTHGSPISIHQIMGGSSCYTVGIAQKSDKPWTISYGASTVEGSSGAPILNVRKEIVGVHIEGGKTANIGTIPELLRSMKESAQNGDINAEDPRSEEEKMEEHDYSDGESVTESEQDRRELQHEQYEQYLVENKSNDYDKTKSWAEVMEDLDNRYEHDTGTILDSRKFKKYVYVADSGATGSHVGQKIKGGRFRKESPWTCSKCLTLHMKAGYNCVKCGYGLKPSVKEVFDEKKTVISECVTPVIADKINSHLEALSAKYQKLEEMITAIQNDAPHPLQYGTMLQANEAMKKFPKEVSMESRLARQLQTAPQHQGFMSPQLVAVRTNPQNPEVRVHLDTNWDEKAPVIASAPMELEVTKKRRRPRRNKGSKETVAQVVQKVQPAVINESAVPLNSKPPLKGGATTTSGVMKKKTSPPKVKLSAPQSAVSTQLDKPQKANSGKAQSK